VLRARQKFVGPTRITPGVGVETNPNVEWNVTTGQLITNPDSADATATAAAYSTAIANSGAMNYLNKFGQLTTNTHKSFDPVSELYYSALRYLKHQGNVPEYTAVPGNTGVGAAQAADGFPIITNWDDPIQYTCQKNVILGIGDVNTHRDKNLPGSTFNTEEPSDPPSVSSDSTVDVVAATNKVGALEGLGTIGSTNNWSGRNNSAYMAGLAYIANTSDIRPEVAMPGKQTVSTHWVDVLEAQVLEPPARNQYYLATKYGGLRIPDDVTFNPMTAAAADIQLDWWHSPAPDNGQTLTSTATPTVDFNRPDNYYLAGNASQMVTSLGKAFQRIAKEVGRTSASSVAANSTRVDTGSAVFQATFNPKRWSGDLAAYAIDTQGNINGTAAWNAAVEVDALSAAQVVSRNVLTIAPPVAAGDGSFVSTTGENFAWASLTPAQQANLQNGDADLTLGQKRLDYLRGSRTFEQDDDDTDTPEPFRQRDSRLGDIVNSDPQFVQHDDFGYALLDQSVAFMATGAGAAYRTFRSDITDRTPMIVVGANDGMLHGINAESLQADGGGDELFAFVPATVYANLADLTDPEYEHRYFVDATPRVADAWFDDDWHTLVIGALGAGGKSYFALDVTDPESVTSSKVLWEFTHPELGFTRGQAAVVPLPNGEFGVVVTSGYETGATDGHIWILNPADGSIIKTIVVPGSGDLGAPLVADLNNDRVADRIYVGDTNGNLWRFDLVGDDPADWNAPAGLLNSGMPLPLFVAEDAAGNRQAITAALTSAFNEHGQHMVFFGTGRFYRVDDNVVPADPPVDSFYGIIDRGMPIGRDDLVEQEVLAEVDAGAIQARGVTAHELNSGDAGWFLDLEWKVANGGTAGAIGERVVTRALVRGDRVVFSTLIPNADPCESGGTSWLMELSTWTGGRLAYSVFDINLDEDFDADDYITVTDENGDVVQIPVSGRKEDDAGIIGQAAVIAVDEGGLAGDEVKVLSSSSGNLIRVAERGGVGLGRQSWRELR
jgi:type IV pilus assembly protein PilY1